MSSRRRPAGAARPARRGVAVAALALVLVAAACSDSDTDGDAGAGGTATTGGSDATVAPAGVAPGEQAAEGSTGTLFVLTSGQATYEEGTPSRLTLEGVGRGVVAFADRPERAATRSELEAFVAGWDGFGFAADPPNAALVGTGDDGAEQVSVVELSDPSLDGDSLSFTATVVDDVDSALLDGLLGATTGPPPASATAVSLFIDAGDAAPPTIVNVQVNIEGLTGTFLIEFVDDPTWQFQQGIPSLGAGGSATSDTPATVQVGYGSLSIESIYGRPLTGGVSGNLGISGDRLQGTATFPEGTTAELIIQGPGTTQQLVSGQPFDLPVSDADG